MTFAEVARALAVGALTLGVLGSPRAALADPPTAEDLASARELYKQGKELRARGDLPGALEKLRAAHALGRTPVTGIELARTLVAAGQLIEAREISMEVPRIPVEPGETGKSTEAREEAAALAESLRGRIPRLVLRVAGVPAGAKVVVTVDGRLVPSVAAGEARLLNPGAHRVRAAVEGRSSEAVEAVELAPGEARELTLTLPPEVPAGTPPAATATSVRPPPPPPPDDAGARRWVGVGLGVAGVGAAVGALTGVYALSLKDDADSSGHCVGSRCDATQRDTVDAARTAGTIATAAFVVAAGGAVIGFIAWIGARRSPAPRAVRGGPWLTAGPVGLAGGF